jgi:hypothetical protein
MAGAVRTYVTRLDARPAEVSLIIADPRPLRVRSTSWRSDACGAVWIVALCEELHNW